MSFSCGVSFAYGIVWLYGWRFFGRTFAGRLTRGLGEILRMRFSSVTYSPSAITLEICFRVSGFFGFAAKELHAIKSAKALQINPNALLTLKLLPMTNGSAGTEILSSVKNLWGKG